MNNIVMTVSIRTHFVFYCSYFTYVIIILLKNEENENEIKEKYNFTL